MTRFFKLPVFNLPLFAMCALVCVPFLTLSGMGEVAAQQNGQSNLLTMWQSQVMVDSTRDKVVEIHLHVHDDRADSYFELKYPGFRQVIALDDLDPSGVPFNELNRNDPVKGARDWAELSKEILEAEGKTDVTIDLVTVPRSTLYALTGTGAVHAIDAETGETRWKTRVGKPSEPTIGLASNNTRVIAVRGFKVYCLNALDGTEIWSRAVQFAPGGGVAVSDDFAYLTAVNGRLQLVPLNDNGYPPSALVSTGAANYDPSVTANTVSWTTDRGFFNVARSNKAALRYRLETDDKVQASMCAAGDKLIANSTNGIVYALHEEKGFLAWEYAVGERMNKTPIAIGDAVMLITSSNKLLGLDTKGGRILSGWPKRISGITDFVGASQDIIYFMGTNGRLVGLSRQSGSVVSLNSIGTGIIPVANHITDRLYVAQANGLVRCLREVANVNPQIRGEGFVVGNSAAEAMMKDKAGQEDIALPSEIKDEPKETAEPAGDPDDPFGGDPDDPFGGDPDDPFGGG